MAMNSELLDILCCPLTRVSLKLLARDDVIRINEEISFGRVKTLAGETIDEPIDEALITEDGERIYMVVQGIPIMLVDRAISVESVKAFLRTA
jgi:uncharacterized protein YbaR (Trm112 family)